MIEKFQIAIVGPDPSLMGGTAAFIRKYTALLRDEKVKYTLFNIGSGDPRGGILNRLHRLLHFTRIAFQTSRSSNNIIHCHAGNLANILGYGIIIFFCWLNRKNIVITLHGGDLHDKLQRNAFNRFIVKKVLAMVGVITTVNQELEKDIRDIGIKNVIFIPNSFSFAPDKERLNGPIPVEVSTFIDTHSPIIVTVGAMEWVHGIDIIVKAIHEVIVDYPIAGSILIAYKSVDANYRDEVIQLMNEFGITDHFCIPSSLPDIFPVLSKATIFIRATRTDGDAISIREALSLGIPVIASDTGFRPKETQLFPVDDSYALADTICALLAMPNQKNYTSYNDNITFQKYIDLYHSLGK